MKVTINGLECDFDTKGEKESLKEQILYDIELWKKAIDLIDNTIDVDYEEVNDQKLLG